MVLLAGLAFGAHMESGFLGAVVLVLLAALFGVGYAGFGILVALRTRNVQATNTSFLLFFPRLFLTPNFVPFDLLRRRDRRADHAADDALAAGDQEVRPLRRRPLSA